MTLTSLQRDMLKKYLSKNLRYRETYIEFYDHILSALELSPENMPLWEAVEKIIGDDFGGYAGIAGIETKYKKAIFKEIQKKYFAGLVRYLKLPLIGVTLILFAVFYMVCLQPWFSFIVFFGLIITMRLIPGMIRSIGHIRSGYIFGNTKKSVKDGVFKWLDYLPGMLFVLYLIAHTLNQPSPVDWFRNTSPIVLAILLMACALHTVVYYKIYQNEFSTAALR
ncbi:MAG: hypothetical protein ACXVAY_09640 [Mucilaginibacter sp.]